VKDAVRRILTKARGVLGLGLVGTAVGFFCGSGVTLLLLLNEVGFPADIEALSTLLRRVLRLGINWSGVGLFTGTGFGALIAVTSGKRSIEELREWKMGLFGAVAGAAFFPLREIIENVLTTAELVYLAPSIAVLGVCGAALGSSVVALAKRAHRSEMAAVEKLKVLPPAE
jgi:hypothetical protein